MLEERVGRLGRPSTGMDQHSKQRAASLRPSPSETDRGSLSSACLRVLRLCTSSAPLLDSSVPAVVHNSHGRMLEQRERGKRDDYRGHLGLYPAGKKASCFWGFAVLAQPVGRANARVRGLSSFVLLEDHLGKVPLGSPSALIECKRSRS